MIDTLLSYDTALFFAINSAHKPWIDVIMFWISSRILWIPLYIWLLFTLWNKFNAQTIYILISIIVLIVLTDQGSVFIKNTFERLRPCHAFYEKAHIVFNYCGGKYGFVSSHAANTFGLAMFISLLLKNKITIVLFSWAALIGYSRIYLGVHYPLDIIGGALLGSAIALSVFIVLYYLLLKKLKHF